MLTSLELTSDKIKLVPLNESHLPSLYEAGQGPSVWTWLFGNYCKTPEILKTWFQTTAQFDPNKQLVFATTIAQTGEVVGTTRFFRLDPANRSVEIGHTFITDKWQRSFVNTHAKYLMLTHAFETLKMVRVEFRTHEHNSKSRNAIARVGATFEGLARKDRLLPNGEYRNTAKFAIIDDDWPLAKQKLELSL
ncbi:GNAT family N-acetyltransferase [Pseudoalteromonas xiamenensis]|uniref:GNAT family N-acetyltransferase n=1 Tax=Pseudoalteromonas xiamenensis TaxID=882626 RepID=UPI0035EBAEA2